MDQWGRPRGGPGLASAHGAVHGSRAAEPWTWEEPRGGPELAVSRGAVHRGAGAGGQVGGRAGAGAGRWAPIRWGQVAPRSWRAPPAPNIWSGHVATPGRPGAHCPMFGTCGAPGAILALRGLGIAAACTAPESFGRPKMSPKVRVFTVATVSLRSEFLLGFSEHLYTPFLCDDFLTADERSCLFLAYGGRN